MERVAGWRVVRAATQGRIPTRPNEQWKVAVPLPTWCGANFFSPHKQKGAARRPVEFSRRCQNQPPIVICLLKLFSVNSSQEKDNDLRSTCRTPDNLHNGVLGGLRVRPLGVWMGAASINGPPTLTRAVAPLST